jgi:hypothetical protein
MSLTDPEDYEALDRLTVLQHENARNKGFVDLHDKLKDLAMTVRRGGAVSMDPALADYILQCEAGNELMLIVTELGEAHEEIRTSPFPMYTTYFVDEDGNKTLDEFDANGKPRKPEGLGSELADVQIRLGDTVHRRKIGLGREVLRKAIYNASRAARHGGKAF